ncbi:hypothetical protein AF71_00032810 [Rhizobium sp. 57MFTsu3.2]|nr:hypothetical protein [Rhizobium sp. 57MFTsu3.2]
MALMLVVGAADEACACLNVKAHCAGAMRGLPRVRGYGMVLSMVANELVRQSTAFPSLETVIQILG